MAPLYNHLIGAGWNVPLNSLINIETIIPTNDQAFKPPQVYGTYRSGLRRTRGDGLVKPYGYRSLTWLFAVLTRLQYEYLSNNYCGGGVSGFVTLYAPAGTVAYQRVNAVISIPDPADFDAMLYAGKKVPVAMTRIQAAA